MKSYFRFLWRYKALTIIQMVGVSVALSFGIPMVSVFVEFNQMKRDNPRYEDIYGVECGVGAMSFKDEDRYFLDNYPEVEHALMIEPTGRGATETVICDDGAFKARALYCSQDIQAFFPINMVSGTVESLSESGVLLSRSFAEKLSAGDILGGSIRLGDGEEYTVTGIFDGFASHRIPETDIIRDIRYEKGDLFLTNTFLMLKPGTDIAAFSAKVRKDSKDVFDEFVGKRSGGRRKAEVSFLRYDKMVSVGSIDFYGFNSINLSVIIVGILSLLLFLFAFFNYANLSAALSARRAKEFATMRLLGSSKVQVRRRIILENIAFTAICFGFGLLISGLSAGMMRKLFVLADTDVLRHLTFSFHAIVIYILLILLVGFLFGLVPARVITRYSAIDVVKGEFRASEKGFWSKLLVFIQFAVVVCLIFVTSDQIGQIRGLENMDIGCDADNVFIVSAKWEDAEGNDLLMDALRNKPYVKHIGRASAVPGVFSGDVTVSRNAYMIKLVCDKEAFQTFGFGRIEEYNADGRRVGWLTQNAANVFASEPPSFEEMQALGIDCMGGIIEPYVDSGFNPYVVVSDEIPGNFIIMSIEGNHSEARKDITETVSSTMKDRCGYVNVSYCDFLRTLFNEKHKPYNDSIDLLRGYSWIMLILSVLGILGIGLYSTYIHKHDIAVRKVFGATSFQETIRNSRSFILLMAIANAAGLPLGYQISSSMKDGYIEKIPAQPLTFIVTFTITMSCVAAVTYILSYLAARSNPLDSLKTE